MDQSPPPREWSSLDRFLGELLRELASPDSLPASYVREAAGCMRDALRSCHRAPSTARLCALGDEELRTRASELLRRGREEGGGDARSAEERRSDAARAERVLGEIEWTWLDIGPGASRIAVFVDEALDAFVSTREIRRARDRPEAFETLVRELAGPILNVLSQAPASVSRFIPFERAWKRIQDTTVIPLVATLDRQHALGEDHHRAEAMIFRRDQISDVYTLVYRLCTQRRPHNFSKETYEHYAKVVDDFLRVRVPERLADKEDDQAFLRALVDLWRTLAVLLKWLRKVFAYLERFYVRAGHPSLIKLAHLQFVTHTTPFWPRTLAATDACLTVDRDLALAVVDVLVECQPNERCVVAKAEELMQEPRSYDVGAALLRRQATISGAASTWVFLRGLERKYLAWKMERNDVMTVLCGPRSASHGATSGLRVLNQDMLWSLSVALFGRRFPPRA